eukprot:4547669-Amphidinium_carterae.2
MEATPQSTPEQVPLDVAAARAKSDKLPRGSDGDLPAPKRVAGRPGTGDDGNLGKGRGGNPDVCHKDEPRGRSTPC